TAPRRVAPVAPGAGGGRAARVAGHRHPRPALGDRACPDWGSDRPPGESEPAGGGAGAGRQTARVHPPRWARPLDPTPRPGEAAADPAPAGPAPTGVAADTGAAGA